mmetsp:Transcript_103549/g.291454  ORF Transcript_103549/g.291454 Transcript_103549/m.291454 type:complete len:264 (-) Transcript_103549:756-1547(-)
MQWHGRRPKLPKRGWRPQPTRCRLRWHRGWLRHGLWKRQRLRWRWCCRCCLQPKQRRPQPPRWRLWRRWRQWFWRRSRSRWRWCWIWRRRCWMRRRRRWRRLLWRHLRRQRGRLRRRLWKQQRLRWCRRWSSTKRPCSIGRRFRHPAWLELQHQRLGYEPLRRWRGWRRIWYIILLWCSRAHNGCLRRFFLQGILCLGLGVGAFASGAERSRRRRIFFGLGRSRVRQVGCESRRRALMLRVEPDAGFFWCRPWASIRRRPRRL